MMLLTSLVTTFIIHTCRADFDPCASYTLMKYVDQRAVANVLDFGNVPPITDNFLDAGWYRIISKAGENMPTSPPGSFHCGTNYPIWLNGTLPTTVGENVTEKVCLQSYTNICRLTWNINIKFCSGNYLVYNLVTSQLASSGYCFGTSIREDSSTAQTVTTTSRTTGESIINFDPCENHVLMKHVDRRAVENVLDFGNVPSITDNFLHDGWYRVISEAGEDMPTNPPGSFHCGTIYPIWLNGTLPTRINEQVNEKVCLQSFTGVCKITWNIDIKLCAGSYLVYNLLTSEMASSGYCFGTSAVTNFFSTTPPAILTSEKNHNDFDPCAQYSLITKEDRRTTTTLLKPEYEDVPVSDDMLASGWYRVDKSECEEMPTSPPGPFHCGTMYPIWLNGTIPAVVGEQVRQSVCMQAFTSKCIYSWSIDIKRCKGNFVVYNLVTTNTVTSGYCFGKPDACTDDKLVVASKLDDRMSDTAFITVITLVIVVCFLIASIIAMHYCRNKNSKKIRSQNENHKNMYPETWTSFSKTSDI